MNSNSWLNFLDFLVWKLYGLLLGMLVTVKITYNKKKSLFNFNTLMVLIVLIY